MKCIVRKLKAEINNANLPVFEEVVLKNYITTTEDGQSIEIPIYHRLDAAKIEATFELTALTSGTAVNIVSISESQIVNAKSSYVRAVNVSDGTLFSVTANTEITASIDGSDGSYIINGTSGNCAIPYSGESTREIFSVFKTRLDSYSVQPAGYVKIKQVKITDGNNNVYTFKPAEVNGVAVLYDADNGNYYGEVNGGTLLCG